MIAEGASRDAAALRAPWLAQVREVFAEATLTMPAPDAWMM
jgi:ring-1,2-phenylacetyl-CoA epoxidase subunit PaaC